MISSKNHFNLTDYQAQPKIISAKTTNGFESLQPSITHYSNIANSVSDRPPLPFRSNNKIRRPVGFRTATAGDTEAYHSPTVMPALLENPAYKETTLSKTSTATFPLSGTQTQVLQLNMQISAPNPADYFEEPNVEIEKFDRKFSKTRLRQYKYPKIELDRVGQIVEDLQKKVQKT